MPVSTRTAALAASVLALIGLGATVWAISRPAANDPFAACRQGATAPLGGPFTLIDETGKTVTDKDVFTKPSLLYFGYTFCPDVCPLDNARNAEAVDILDGMGIEVTPVFVSVDSKRDTPETLRDFTDVMHPRMIGLTGTPEQIAVASKAYRTYFKIKDEDEKDFYLIDHSTQTYLVFPDRGFVESFARVDQVSPQQLADRVACFVKADAASR